MSSIYEISKFPVSSAVCAALASFSGRKITIYFSIKMINCLKKGSWLFSQDTS